MKDKIILASKSDVRKEILNKNGIAYEVLPANIDEEQVKQSLLEENATPGMISKNLAELKANKVSKKKINSLYWALIVLLISRVSLFQSPQIGMRL